MKKIEYAEGPKATKAFESMMMALFRASKPQGRKESKAASSRKSKRADKD
jgi:hypothetical protein